MCRALYVGCEVWQGGKGEGFYFYVVKWLGYQIEQKNARQTHETNRKLAIYKGEALC